jgi:hypothetical protein
VSQAIFGVYFVLQSVPATVYTEREAMKLIGHITLSDGLGTENPDRTFIHQTLEIDAETRTSRLGLDGKLYIARCPRNVTWYGGSPAFFAEVTRIRIVRDGLVLIDEAVDTRQQPWSVPGGVSFNVADTAPSGR